MDIHGHCSDLREDFRASRHVGGLARALRRGFLACSLLLLASTAFAQAYPDPLANTATVTVPSTAVDPDTTNNNATDSNALAASAGLSLTKTLLTSSPAPVSSTVQYQVVVTNAGPSSAVGASVTDTVPAELTNVSWSCTASAGSSCASPSGTGNAISLLADIAPSGSLTVTISGTAPASGTIAANTATVTPPTGTTDPDPTDNTDTVPPIPVAGVANLGVVKTLLTASPAPAGSTVQYQVVVTNAGPSAAVGATVTDTVPAELTNVSWTCTASAGSSCAAPSGTGNAISMLADIAPSGSVTLTVSGTAPASGTIGANTATVTPPTGTTDPDPTDNTDTVPPIPVTPVPTVSIDSPSTTEGSPMVFTVSLSGASASPVTVTLTTSDGTANAPADYTATTTTVTIPAGQTSATVSVPTAADGIYEGNETFNATLSNPVGATLGTAVGVGTIIDANAVPTLSINDVSVAETAGTATFTVSLSGPSALPVTVAYATANGTATSPADFAATSGTLTFAPGVTSQPIAVSIVNDAIAEGNETFTVGLSNPTVATIADGSGLGTIVDDESGLLVSIDSPSTTEGSPMVFTVSLSGTSASPVTVTLTTSNGTATAPADYTATTTTVTIPAGQTSATVSVPTAADGIFEGNETFNATLTNPVGATLGTAIGVGTIIDANAAPTLSINDVSVAENAGTATFTVSLSGPSALPVTVAYATANGTATSPADFGATSGTLTFAPGVTSQSIPVLIVNDAIAEGNETFTVELSNTTVATIVDGSGLGTIVDDESGLLVSIDSPSTTEGSPMVFTVSLSGTSASPVTVTLTTSDGTANAPADYTATTTTVTIPAGQTSATVSVPTAADGIFEGNETFNATLSNPVGATLGTTVGIGTILDATPAPTLSINDVSVAENAGTATFTVSLSGPSALPVTVAYATANGTATSPADFGATSGTLTFAPGVTSQSIPVSIVNDAIAEGNETFTIGLSNPTVATIADGSGLGTIVDDDSGGADLSVEKTLLTASPAPANSTVQYQVVVSNAGPAAVVGATVTDSVPAELTNVTWTCIASAGSNCATASGTGNAISVQANIAAGGTITLLVSGMAPASGTIGANTAVASVPPGTTDPDPTDNTDTTPPIPVTPVAPVTDLGVDKTLLTASPAPAGSTVTYRLVVTNAGPAVATGATITDTVPSELTNVTWTCAATGTSSCGAASGTGNVNLIATVGVGVANAITITVSGTAPASGTIGANTATVSPPPGTTDPDPTDDTDTVPPVPVTPIVLPAISVNDVVVEEHAGAAVFTVALNRASATPVTVAYETRDGTAVAPYDYTATTGTLTFAPGVTTLPVSVTIVNDTLDEENETHTLVLSNPTMATLADPIGLNTIVDNDAPAPAQLRLTKQAATREVRVGDLVRYTVSIENVGTVDAVNATLVDTPPAGFTYVDGSLLVDDTDDSAVVVGTNPLRIEGIDVVAGGRGTVVYYLRVGAGVGPGIFANHVVANDDDGDTISNIASAEVEVTGDPLLDESLILGSVFDDRNGNGLQDMGERGVPGVRIASVEGLVMETDAHGRYHLVGIPVDNKARGRNFILKVDTATLPPGTVFTTSNPLVRRITAGLPVRFDFGVKLPDGRLGGGQSRVDIDLAEVLFAPGSAEVKPEHAAVIDRIAATVREYGGGRLTVTASGDGEALALRRAQAVQAALLERLEPSLRERTSVAVVSWVEPEQSLVSLGNTVALGHLLFDTDREAIRPQYEALIRELAATIERQHGGTLEVHGHADRRGSDDYNMKLAMRRAKAVADAIAARLSPEARARLRVDAVDPSRVATTGQR